MKEQILLERITPAKAKAFLEKNRRNRPVSESVVNRYAEIMNLGQWRVVGDAIVIDSNGDLRNGQHRLKAVVKSGKTCTFPVMYDADPDSFADYDCGRRRVASQIFAMEGIPNYTTVSSIVHTVMALREGRTAIQSMRSRKTNQQMLDEYARDPEGYQGAVHLAASLYTSGDSFGTSRLGGYAYYLQHDLHYPVQRVVEFFKAVFSLKSCENIMLEKFRCRLIEDMASNKKLTPIARYALLVKCWNAYISGRSLKTLKWIETEGVPQFE